MVGGGAYGHLGIIMNQVEYAVISATPWAEPFNHGAIPIIPPGTSTVYAAQIARMHEFRCIYTNIINMDQALKRIMLEAYNNVYTPQLEDYPSINKSLSPSGPHVFEANLWLHQSYAACREL
jgi:hypothetical protein